MPRLVRGGAGRRLGSDGSADVAPVLTKLLHVQAQRFFGVFDGFGEVLALSVQPWKIGSVRVKTSLGLGREDELHLGTLNRGASDPMRQPPPHEICDEQQTERARTDARDYAAGTHDPSLG